MELARGAAEDLHGARLPDAYDLPVVTERGLVLVTVDRTGTCLQQLGHACFQAALEGGLQRYSRWLVALAEGHPFPTEQLHRRT